MTAPSGAGSSGADRLKQAAKEQAKQKVQQAVTQKTAGAIPGVGQAVTAAKAAKKTTEAAKSVNRAVSGTDGHLGAGGTSSSAGRIQDEQKASDRRLRTGVAAGAAAGVAAPAAAQVSVILALIKWLKMMAAMALAAITNAANAALMAVMAVFKAVAAFFASIGATIAATVGGLVSATVGTVMAVAMTVMLVVGAIFGVGSAQQNVEVARHDRFIEDCSVAVKDTVAAAAIGANTNASAATEANAQRVYSILKGWGGTDTAIAGLLGNWTHESGIDSTGVETIYNEPFVMGPQKLAAEADFNSFTLNRVFPTYEPKFTPKYAAYVGMDGTYYPGLGLGQWTGPRAQMLVEWGQKMNQPWHSFETQLSFLVAGDYPYAVQIFKEYIRQDFDTPGAAADDFRIRWEGARFGNVERIDAANIWYAKLGGWTVDQALADSILAQAGTAMTLANSSAVQTAMDKCRTSDSAAGIANTDAATAAASLAWPYLADSRYNDGTYLYVWLHEQIFPGDPYFASCDRAVATAIRWSGTDDTYPAGPVASQLAYLSSSPKWTQVDWGGDYSKLLPGDVFIRKDASVSHTAMWLGTQIPDQVWGVGAHEPGANMIHASLSRTNGRSPGADVAYGGTNGIQTYAVFRSTGKEASSRYTSLIPPAEAGLGLGDKARYTTPH